MNRGAAMAVAGWALHVLANKPQRLHWCVDLPRDVGQPRETDPGPWVGYLERCRAALDRMPHGTSTTPIALTVRSLVRSANGCDLCRYDVEGREQHKLCPGCAEPVTLTFSLPTCVDLVALCTGPPPVGVWRLWPLPPESRKGGREGDTVLPTSFWHDAIPF